MQLGSSYYSDGELVVTGIVFGQALKLPESFVNVSILANNALEGEKAGDLGFSIPQMALLVWDSRSLLLVNLHLL